MSIAEQFQIDGSEFPVIAEINDAIKYGRKLDVDFEKPKFDFRMQAASKIDNYLRQYQAYLDAQMAGQMYGQFEFGTMNPFSYLDTQYVVHPREIEKIDGEVASVLRAMAIADTLFENIDVGRGKLSEKIYENKDPLDPVLSKNFKTYEPGKEATVEKEIHFQGVHKDYEFGMVELDASRGGGYFNSDVLERTTQEFMALVADFKERILWRGGDIRTTRNSGIDGRVKGLVNWTGIQTQTTTTDFTTFGNMTTAITDSIKQLKNYHYKPPFFVVCTPWVFIQALKNRHTYSNKTELWEILNLGNETGYSLVSGVVSTPHLLKVDESTTTGAMYVIAPIDNKGRSNIVILESYPAWHYPLTLGTQIGVAGKFAWMGSMGIRRAESVVATTAITTN